MTNQFIQIDPPAENIDDDLDFVEEENHIIADEKDLTWKIRQYRETNDNTKIKIGNTIFIMHSEILFAFYFINH